MTSSSSDHCKIGTIGPMFVSRKLPKSNGKTYQKAPQLRFLNPRLGYQ
jgi:hypothetical protein